MNLIKSPNVGDSGIKDHGARLLQRNSVENGAYAYGKSTMTPEPTQLSPPTVDFKFGFKKNELE